MKSAPDESSVSTDQQERWVLADNSENWPDPTGERSAHGLKQFVESQLVARIAAGDRRALRTLYEIYFPQLATFFRHLTQAPAESLINDTLLEVWRNAESVDPDGSVFAWIMRIAVTRARLQRPMEISCSAVGWKTALLAKLSIEQRAILHFVYTGHARSQIAEILGISIASVDTLLTQARLVASISAKNSNSAIPATLPAGFRSLP